MRNERWLTGKLIDQIPHLCSMQDISKPAWPDLYNRAHGYWLECKVVESPGVKIPWRPGQIHWLGVQWNLAQNSALVLLVWKTQNVVIIRGRDVWLLRDQKASHCYSLPNTIISLDAAKPWFRAAECIAAILATPSA